MKEERGPCVHVPRQRQEPGPDRVIFVSFFFSSVALNSSSSPLHPRCQTDVKIPQNSNLNRGL